MKLEISGLHTDVSDKLKRHISKKINHLDNYLPVSQLKSAHATVRVKDSTTKRRQQVACEITLRLRGKTLVINETGDDAFLVIDKASAKLKLAIKQYKERRITRTIRGRLRRKNRSSATTT